MNGGSRSERRRFARSWSVRPSDRRTVGRGKFHYGLHIIKTRPATATTFVFPLSLFFYSLVIPLRQSLMCMCVCSVTGAMVAREESQLNGGLPSHSPAVAAPITSNGTTTKQEDREGKKLKRPHDDKNNQKQKDVLLVSVSPVIVVGERGSTAVAVEGEAEDGREENQQRVTSSAEEKLRLQGLFFSFFLYLSLSLSTPSPSRSLVLFSIQL